MRCCHLKAGDGEGEKSRSEQRRCNREVRSNIKEKGRAKSWSCSQAAQIPVEERRKSQSDSFQLQVWVWVCTCQQFWASLAARCHSFRIESASHAHTTQSCWQKHTRAHAHTYTEQCFSPLFSVFPVSHSHICLHCALRCLGQIAVKAQEGEGRCWTLNWARCCTLCRCMQLVPLSGGCLETFA